MITKKTLKRFFQRLKPFEPEEGESVINQIGHRNYVGGLWDELGALQIEFLLKEGLKSSDCLLDIGCGSFRGGTHFINYLNKGNYIGIDKDPDLIDRGIKIEIGKKTIQSKKPIIIISSNFNFKKIKKKPNISFAQSLFTHLNLDDIGLCLTNLREIVVKGHRFYATFKEGSPLLNRKTSNSFSVFSYYFKTISDIGLELGWEAHYIGDWGHPRNQKIIKFTAT